LSRPPQSAPFAELRRVFVGSTSPPKISAVRTAFERFGASAEVTGVDVPSGVSPQPVGLAEITAGARNRAREAYARDAGDRESAGVLAVGIEDGLVVLAELGSDPLNLACAVVCDRNRESAALSSAFAYPSMCAEPALSGRTPIGEVFDVFWRERTGVREREASGRGEGNVGKLTLGVLTREEYARHAVVCALIRFLHPDLYFASTAGE
jgi:inosine/xanthosine triphosphatase